MEHTKNSFEISPESKETAQQIKDFYTRFGVTIGDLVDVAEGARVSRYEFELLPETKISKITTLRDDISLMLSVPKVRLICPIPHRMGFAVEVPNKKERFVEFDEVLLSETDKLGVLLGKDLFDETVYLDLAKAPHLLIGGGACAGKTMLLKTIICSLMLKNAPSEVKFLVMAPQKDELEVFETFNRFLSPVICDKEIAFEWLNNLFEEGAKRIKLFAEHSVRNIDAYNEIAKEKLHKVVVVVDEISFLTGGKLREFETIVSRLAQIGRMAGIHMILATKDLTPKNVTGIIKANIPTRIALSVQNPMESRTIIDTCDAECLLPKGDLLFCDNMLHKPQRIQAVYLTDEQIRNLIVKGDVL